MFTDPTGEELHYSDDEDEDEYTYKIENGKIVVCNSAGVKINDISTLSDIQQLVIASLNELIQYSIGRETVNYIIDDDTIILITYDGGETGFKPSTQILSFNPKDFKGGVSYNSSTFSYTLNTPQFVRMGHELFHVEDFINGTLDKSTWVMGSDGRPIYRCEMYACAKENALRLQAGLSLRESYEFQRDPRNRDEVLPVRRTAIPPFYCRGL